MNSMKSGGYAQHRFAVAPMMDGMDRLQKLGFSLHVIRFVIPAARP